MQHIPGSEEIARSEHLGPLSGTGDNIDAKRVGMYVWDSASSAWTRFTGGGSTPFAWDALTYTASSSTVDTYKYYVGGTSGTLVSTLTVTYTDSSHATLVSVVRT